MGIRDIIFTNQPKLNVAPMFPKKLSCIFAYCDITEPLYLGEQRVHLLDVNPIPHMHLQKSKQERI